MSVKGYNINWPESTEPGKSAEVSRRLADRSHKNTLVLRIEQVYVYWASPRLLAPAENWHLHASSVPRRNADFDPAKDQGIKWEHFTVASDGLVGFQFSADRTYQFYFTPDDASEDELKKKHVPWPCFVYEPKDAPGQVRILFPVLPISGDAHGDEYAEEFDLKEPLNILLVFNSDEHLALGDSAQRLVDMYAVNGLIDGGAMISYPDNNTPIDQWKIEMAQEDRGPEDPYGLLGTFSNYHWHYVIPGKGPAGPWTPQQLQEAIWKGEAVAVSIGQILMLAGDFYGSFEDMLKKDRRPLTNIMEGVHERKRLACMVLDVGLLPHGMTSLGKLEFMQEVSNDPNALDKKVSWIKVQALARLLGKLGGPTNYSEMHTLAQLLTHPQGNRIITAERLLPWVTPDVRKDLLDFMKAKEIEPFDDKGFKDEIWNVGVTRGQYADLALSNAKHFSCDEMNWKEFQTHHGNALSLIALQNMAGSSNLHPIPAEAVARTAFGLHFLTDSFSAGHMRVPRAKLGLTGALAAKLMHDMDGFYGLLVKDGFGNCWRAFGDGNIRRTSLKGPQTAILEKIRNQKKPGVDADPETNWTRAMAAVAAAFKQLHYQAQAFFKGPGDAPVLDLKGSQRVLWLSRGSQSLNWDDLAQGAAAEQLLLEDALKVDANGKLSFMKKYYPRPVDAPELNGGTAPPRDPKNPLLNHPPLFDGSGAVNAAARAYYVTHAWNGKERHLNMRWHGVGNDSIDVDFSDFYYLARYTVGSQAEGWIKEDETRLVDVFDHLPTKAPDPSAPAPTTSPTPTPPPPAPLPLPYPAPTPTGG